MKLLVFHGPGHREQGFMAEVLCSKLEVSDRSKLFMAGIVLS
jgi:hypothetical protein